MPSKARLGRTDDWIRAIDRLGEFWIVFSRFGHGTEKPLITYRSDLTTQRSVAVCSSSWRANGDMWVRNQGGQSTRWELAEAASDGTLACSAKQNPDGPHTFLFPLIQSGATDVPT